MTCKQTLKDVLLKCDIFSTSEFLRYDSEPEYRTLTGAFCSIATIIAFFAIFTNVIVGTLAKEDVTWSLNTVEEQVDSFGLDAQVDGQNKFMFGVMLGGMDLNSGLQYFDVNLTLKTRSNSVQRESVSVKLQQCTPSHWNVNEQILKTYYRMNFSNMLCPPIGQKIPIQGKYTSQSFKYAQIQILKCTNTSKMCVDDASLQNRTFVMSFFFLNSLINPELQDYVSYYLQDRNYIQFTTEYTSELNIFISKFKITTDQSILPYQSSKEQIGSIVNNLAQLIPHPAEGRVFANVILRRASTSVLVNRSFTKVDQTLSYIGGLFGFVMIFLLLMKQYTEYSFQIDASSHLYHEDKENPIDSDKFNFLVFIGYLFYLFLSIFGVELDWKIMKTFDDSREQVQKQFDIRFLFERLNFVQKSLRILFDDDEAKFIHLNRKPTLKEASQLRQKYKFKERIRQKSLEMTQCNLNNETVNYQGSKGINDSKVMGVDKSQNALKEMLTETKTTKALRKLRKKTQKGHEISKKIIEHLDPHIAQIIHENNEDNISQSHAHQYSIQKLQNSQRHHPKRISIIAENQIYIEEEFQKQPKGESACEVQREKDHKLQRDFQFMN